jgi:hypothetical protein
MPCSLSASKVPFSPSFNRHSAIIFYRMRTSFVLAFVASTALQVVDSSPAPQAVSRTARCGPSFGLTCRGSSFGNCCSKNSYCGSTKDYCSMGCQSGWGTCNSAPSSIPSATPKVSNDGKCGGDNGATCSGSQYGNCCRYACRLSMINRLLY